MLQKIKNMFGNEYLSFTDYKQKVEVKANIMFIHNTASRSYMNTLSKERGSSSSFNTINGGYTQ